MTASLSGVPAETLRMWERRYGFPHPRRSGSGARRYTQGDVDRLTRVRDALAIGYRPSDVIHLDVAGLDAALAVRPTPRANTSPTDPASALSALLAAVAREALPDVRRALQRAVLMFGPRTFLREIAGPACTRVGELWAQGALEIRQEHLFTAALATELHYLSAGLVEYERAPVVVLATLPLERHTLGLEMVALEAAIAGLAPRLLGAEMPVDELAAAARAHGAAVVGLSATAASDVKTTRRAVRALLDATRADIWVGGAGASALGLDDERVASITSWAALEQRIAKITTGAPA